MEQFKDDEKIKLFDVIAENYFDRNFGRMSKADFETLLFSAYIDHLISENKPTDDYVISKQLGLKQARVRSLKENKELKYPTEYDWREAFANCVGNAKYDEKSGNVKVIVQDVNVLNDVRYFIEKNGWYDDYSLNRKLLSIPKECFLSIFVSGEDFRHLFSQEVKRNIKNIKTDDTAIQAFIKDFSEEGLKNLCMNASTEVLKLVLNLLPFGNIAKSAIGVLFDTK